MISGASEEELTEAIGRADVLLEFMPKIKQLQKENKQLKEVINKAIELNQIINNSDYVYSQDEITTKNLDILKEVSE